MQRALLDKHPERDLPLSLACLQMHNAARMLLKERARNGKRLGDSQMEMAAVGDDAQEEKLAASLVEIEEIKAS